MESMEEKEIELKVEEMHQTKEIENKKLELEREKLEFEKTKYKDKLEADQKNIDGVKAILEGPIGEAIQKIGESFAGKLKPKEEDELDKYLREHQTEHRKELLKIMKEIDELSKERAYYASKTSAVIGRLISVKCPACGGIFPVNHQLVKLTCPLCGVGLERPSQPTPPIRTIEELAKALEIVIETYEHAEDMDNVVKMLKERAKKVAEIMKTDC